MWHVDIMVSMLGISVKSWAGYLLCFSARQLKGSVEKGGRFFTQNLTLSETLQISHAVLFTWVKQCSACFFPEICFLFEILRMRKNTFF